MGQTKLPMYWCWTVPLSNAQMGLGALGELRCGANGQSRTVLASCPLYHPPNGTLGLAALDDDTVDWLKRTTLNI